MKRIEIKSHAKKPLYQQKIEKNQSQYKNATKNFDCITSADRLRAVSWSNDSHPTCVVLPVSGPKLSTNQKSYVIKRTHLKISKFSSL